MPESERISKTPILDLEQPLPTRPKNRASGAKAVIVLTVVAVFVLRTLIPVVILLGYFFVSLATAAVHEFGHWVAGRSVGLRLSYLVIGPLRFVRHSDQWRMHWRSSATGGLILMSLDKVRRIRRRLIVWAAGGPIASLLMGAVALVACRAKSIGGNPYVGLPVAGFAIFSILAGIQSLRSLKFGGYSGDGVLFRMLLSSYEGARQQIAAHALHMLESSGWDDPCFWNRRWISVASRPSEVYGTTFHTDWLQYQLSSDPNAAAECLERCLAGLALLPPDQREEDSDQVFLEAAIFMAWHRNDAKKAQVWFDVARHPERTSAMRSRRVQIALNYARGDFDKAIAGVEEALSFLERIPARTRVEVLKSSFREWRSAIRTKRDEAALGDALVTGVRLCCS